MVKDDSRIKLCIKPQENAKEIFNKTYANEYPVHSKNTFLRHKRFLDERETVVDELWTSIVVIGGSNSQTSNLIFAFPSVFTKSTVSIK